MIRINSIDVCVQGFERLRCHSEFMLVVPIDPTDTIADVVQHLKDDAQSSAPEDIDIEQLNAAIDARFVPKDGLTMQSAFDPEIEAWGDGDNGCNVFVYCEHVTA